MAILTGLCSCRKNLLDVAPTNLLSATQIVSNDGAVTAWAASLYRDLPMEDFSFIEGNFWRFPDGGTQYLANLSDEAATQWNPGGSYMNPATYDQIYKAIRNVNSFISLVGAATANFPAAQIAQYVAEGQFIRAYCYYGLVKYYGGVPIVLDIPANPIPLPRNKETDVYDLIKTDLDAAVAGLPALPAGYLSTNTIVNNVTYGYGRANKWVALALESRVMLHAGSEGLFGANDANFTTALAGSQAGTTGIVGIDAAHGNTYMQAAFNASAAIIASNVFTLYNKYSTNLPQNFEYLFYDTKQGDSNTEAIFNRGYDFATSGSYTHSEDLLVLPDYIRSAVGYDNALEASCDLMDKFETTDGSNPAAAPSIGTLYHYPSMTAPFVGKEARYHGTLVSNGTFFRTAIITSQKGVILNGSQISGSANVQFFDTKVGSSTYKQFNADPTKFNAGDTYVVGTGNSNRGDQTTWLKKWTDPVTDITLIRDYTSRTSWMDMRYGEVLLDYAEASFELGHAPSESLAVINQIRARAGLAPLAAISRAAIRHERLVELAYENKTWWDYVRWRAITSDFTNRQEYNMDCFWDIDTNDYVYVRVTDGGARNFPSSMYYNNIPSSDLGTDALLIKNPGY